MRRILTAILVLMLAVPCFGAQWFIDTSSGIDASYDGKQTAIITTETVEDLPFFLSGSTYRIAMVSSADAALLETQRAAGRTILHVSVADDPTTDFWLRMTSIIGSNVYCSRLGTDGDTVPARPATADAIIDIIGTGPKKTFAGIDAVLVATETQTVWYLDGTYDEAVAIDNADVGSTYTLTLRSFSEDATAVTLRNSSADAATTKLTSIPASATVAFRDLTIRPPNIATASNEMGIYAYSGTAPWYVTATDCVFDGTDNASPYTAVGCISAGGVLTATGCSSTGINARQWYLDKFKRVTIDGWTCTNATGADDFIDLVSSAGTGEWLEVKNCVVNWDTAANPYYFVSLFKVRGISNSSRTIWIHDNTVTANGLFFDYEAAAFSYDVDEKWHVIIEDNTFCQQGTSTAKAISIGTDESWDYGSTECSVERAWIRNNTIHQADASSDVSVGHLLLIGGGVDEVVVAGNKIYSTDDNGNVFGIVDKTRKSKYIGNFFYGQRCLYLVGSQNTLVERNTFYGTEDFCLALNHEPAEELNGTPAHYDGQATAGAATTITLAAGASTTDSTYVGMWIYLNAGTGTGQWRRITAYDGDGGGAGALVATVDSAWTTNPDNTTDYIISSQPFGNTIRNNIFVSSATGCYGIKIGSTTTGFVGARANVIDYNAFYNATGANSYYADGAARTLAVMLSTYWPATAAWATDLLAFDISNYSPSATNDLNSVLLTNNPIVGTSGTAATDLWRTNAAVDGKASDGGRMGAWQRKSGSGGLFITNP